MRVALDAGHGMSARGRWTGARGNGIIEDRLVFDLVGRIGHYLRAAGHETVLTRPSERLVPIALRPRIAHAEGCDMFLSVHANAGSASASGVEAFVVASDARSVVIARRITRTMARALESRDRGARWDTDSRVGKLGVLRGAWRRMPAVLLEVGFITNPAEAAKLKNRVVLDKVARAIAAETALAG